MKTNNINKKTILITGITGQDGAYLAELLLSKNHTVYGTYHLNNQQNFWRLKELKLYDYPLLHLIEHDLTDLKKNIHLLEKVNFSEIYNLAASSFVSASIDQPYTTMQTIGLGALNLLEAIRLVNPKIRFYQASSAEMFGNTNISPQTETTTFCPNNPYSVAKLYAHFATINYAETYDMFACSGILFNHESPLRGREFVTRKITATVAEINAGLCETLILGNLNVARDWGYAKEYIEAMYLMLQAGQPDNYILATGRTETVRKFVELAFSAANIPIVWQGSKEAEVGINALSGKIVVTIDAKLYRPVDTHTRVGDPTKAKQKLGWIAKTSLEQLCQMMVAKDMERYAN